MAQDIEGVVSAGVVSRRVGRGKRHDPMLRTKALELVRGGTDTKVVATQLGLPESTVASWAGAACGVKGFARVALVAPPVGITLRIGAAVAELSVGELAELVRRLS